MSAPKGNRFWEARSTHGRNPIFPTPEALWDACVQYFEWVEANPLQEEKLFHSNGVVVKDVANKMRAMTISGLCVFLDISTDAWENYCKREGFVGVTTRVRNIIFNQKFAGASADLLNANIIARELGLKDGSDITSNGNTIAVAPIAWSDE